MKDHTIQMNLEAVMGDRFGKYSKYIIQERALPDVRDGLKPVQRRILYAMFKEGNVNAKAFRKSAKTVGVVIGNYHPHGDTSVYDAMVRMSQDWKLRHPLVEMHGNNGSIDNDPAAAMRYTEARLAKLSETLLQDLDKETVLFALNFDDTEEEPTVLPAKFPHLLVNGATGISAGYATDIPPHNLGEVIDATIHRLNTPDSTLSDLMHFVQGPDFPTGAIVQGKKGIEDALQTGKGRMVIRSKVEIIQEKNKQLFVVTEVPYEVNKADLVRKMDEIRLNKAVEGIIEVRDETDRTGLRIVIEVKKEVDATSVLNYLYKNTDLQRYYSYNMVAISDQRPRLMGLVEMLDAYIGHRIEVVTNRTLYDLKKAKVRLHVVEGLIKALDVLDEVVHIIRQSKDKGDAKNNLSSRFGFTDVQAEAIVILRLYRLTNTDVSVLFEESNNLMKTIQGLQNILDDHVVLKGVIETELLDIKTQFATPRQTIIEEEISEIVIAKEAMIASEDVMVSVTQSGYIKRMSLRSVGQNEMYTCGKKEGDPLVTVTKANTLEHLLVFFDSGLYVFVPVHVMEEAKWKDVGKHISYIASIPGDHKVVYATIVPDFSQPYMFVSLTKQGLIKRTLLNDFFVQRYSKALKYINLKDQDQVVNVAKANGQEEVIIATMHGYHVRYPIEDISMIGIKAAGVKAINLKDDQAVSMVLVTQTTKAYTLISHEGGLKRFRLEDIPIASRTTRGHLLLKPMKTTIQYVLTSLLTYPNDLLVLYTENQEILLHPKMVNYSEIKTSFTFNELVKSRPLIYGVFHQMNQTEQDEPIHIEHIKQTELAI